MGRRWQVFIAPGEEDDDLPVEESPWNIGREARLPKEHWDLIVELAKNNDPELGVLLEQIAYLDGDFSQWNEKKTKKLYKGLKQLCFTIDKSEPLAPEVSNEIPEDHPPEDHILMVRTVMAVIEESQRMGEMFDSYIDS